jgi:hypothetical protein
MEFVKDVLVTEYTDVIKRNASCVCISPWLQGGWMDGQQQSTAEWRAENLHIAVVPHKISGTRM